MCIVAMRTIRRSKRRNHVRIPVASIYSLTGGVDSGRLQPPSCCFFFCVEFFLSFLFLLDLSGPEVWYYHHRQHSMVHTTENGSRAREREYGMPDIFSFVWLQREKEIDEIIIPSHFSKKRTMEKRNVVSNLCGSLSRFNGGH